MDADYPTHPGAIVTPAPFVLPDPLIVWSSIAGLLDPPHGRSRRQWVTAVAAPREAKVMD